MLSELCVRRPVFATMLVTSLVVLGIFSFRDLGVDLFPRADPATVNVSLRLPGAAPDEMTSAVVMRSARNSSCLLLMNTGIRFKTPPFSKRLPRRSRQT